jgi:hypothetical protein
MTIAAGAGFVGGSWALMIEDFSDVSDWGHGMYAGGGSTSLTTAGVPAIAGTSGHFYTAYGTDGNDVGVYIDVFAPVPVGGNPLSLWIYGDGSPDNMLKIEVIAGPGAYAGAPYTWDKGTNSLNLGFHGWWQMVDWAGWRRLILPFSPSPDSIERINLFANDTAAPHAYQDIYIDSIEVIPEPSTITLFASGLLGLISCVRLRRNLR